MKLILKSFYVLIFSALIAGASFTVAASELTEPKAKGIIGERFDGYLGIVNSAPANIKALVKSVNAKRKARYKQIAKKRQQPLSKVELIAGAAAIKKTKKGNFIFLKGKGWSRK
ncbi:MAG: YdbL family protein [Kangiellaceae bacterium]|nr:YdbL family protein [Kangiellaceae bacterium]MCW9000527.1 YdbL family protein [Kangiellaceae bacterium]MCW9017698.1 YdbL family protein [Kangiellaceae bacterium]